MKLYSLFTAAALLSGQHAIAANHDSLSRVYSPFWHEISLSIGHWSTDMMTIGWGNQHRNATVNHFSGALCANYKLRLSPRVFLGAGIAYEQESGDLLKINITGRTAFTADTIGNYKSRVVTVVPDFTWIYGYNTENNSIFYATAGVGISYVDLSTNATVKAIVNKQNPLLTKPGNVHFNGQISPLCFKIGYNRFSGFVEFGFGYKGIVCLGGTWKY